MGKGVGLACFVLNYALVFTGSSDTPSDGTFSSGNPSDIDYLKGFLLSFIHSLLLHLFSLLYYQKRSKLYPIIIQNHNKISKASIFLSPLLLETGQKI